MKSFYLFCIISISSICVNAQVMFPKVNYYKVKDNAIIMGNYIPEGTFALLFPNFLNDGKYYLNSTIPNWTFSALSDKSAPAIFTNSDKKLEFGNIVFSLSTDSAMFFTWFKSGAHVGSYDFQHAEVLKYPKQYFLTQTAIEEYNEINNFYKKTADTILAKKGASNIFITNLAQREYGYDSLTACSIILDVRLENYTWGTENFSTNFPSLEQYSLIIRNAYGEIIRSYHQVVFLSLKISDHVFNYGLVNQRMSSPIFTSTFKYALESLINQFLNDEETINRIKSANENIKQKIQADSSYIKIVNTKIKYGALMARKEELTQMCKDLQVDFNGVSALVKYDENNKVLFVPSSSLSSQMNTSLENTGAALDNVIDAMIEKGYQKENNEKLKVLYNSIAEFKQQIFELIGSITALPPSLYKEEFLTEMEKDDNSLTDAINTALSSKDNASKDINDHLASINANMQSLQNGMQSSVTTSASTNGGTNLNNTIEDQCSQQATIAWKRSSEYQTYMRTQLNADASDCKAKLIELTVQYCSSNFSPKQIADLQKIANEARQEAKDLRNSNNFKWGN